MQAVVNMNMDQQGGQQGQIDFQGQHKEGWVLEAGTGTCIKADDIDGSIQPLTDRSKVTIAIAGVREDQ
jgi:hypothetical protein